MLKNEERPWGKCEELFHDPEQSYRVKKYTVNPGQTLSVQYHSKRGEVWNVVSGVGIVSVSAKPFSDGEAYEMVPAQQIMGSIINIPVSYIHTAHVPTEEKQPFVFIEVQIGNTDEDDVVMLHDEYGRV